MLVHLFATLGLVVFYLALIGRHVGFGRPDVLFAIIHAVTAAGTIIQLDATFASEARYSSLLLWCLVVFLVGSSVTHVLLRTRRVSTLAVDDSAQFGSLAMAFLVFGMIIVVLYFVAVGYSALLIGFQSALSGTNNDVATYRLESYAGSRYLFPGYVNQFKNALVPTLIALMIINWKRSGIRGRGLVSVFLVLFAAFSLLGTAQRTAGALFILVLLLILWQLDRSRAGVRAVLVLIATIPLLLISTFSLGRQQGSSDNVGVWGLFLELVGRLLGGDTDVEIRGFRYIESLPVANGAEWLQSLIGLLPGRSGSTLPNQIFELSYGSSRGNAQPSLWASAYHNFGEAGALLVALFLGIGLASFTCFLNKTTVRNLYEIGGIAGLTVVLATWTVGSPVVPLNQGLPAYLLLLFVGYYIRRRAERSDDNSRDEAVVTEEKAS